MFEISEAEVEVEVGSGGEGEVGRVRRSGNEKEVEIGEWWVNLQY